VLNALSIYVTHIAKHYYFTVDLGPLVFTIWIRAKKGLLLLCVTLIPVELLADAHVAKERPVLTGAWPNDPTTIDGSFILWHPSCMDSQTINSLVSPSAKGAKKYLNRHMFDNPAHSKEMS